MVQKLSEEDIQAIADAIVEHENRDFAVDPRDHYGSHARIDSFLKAYDTASNIVLKSIMALFIVGIVFAVAMGAGWTKP